MKDIGVSESFWHFNQIHICQDELHTCLLVNRQCWLDTASLQVHAYNQRVDY